MRAHLSINVRNVSESAEFYGRVFGVKPQKQTKDYAKFDLKEPSLNFSMLTAQNGRQPSQVNHLGIEVESAKEVAEWKGRLDSLGVKTLSEEATDCCYALQDKVWFQDPDGNSWEVFYVHAQLPVEAAEPPKAKSMCKAGSGCC